MFFKKNKPRSHVSKLTDINELTNEVVPKHMAIILDGNGRWAAERGKPRMFGHQEGMINVKHVAEIASKKGIEVLTLYAFSTENWKRAADEVAFLMKLPIRFFDEFAPVLMELNIAMEIIGNKKGLPKELQRAIENIETLTGKNSGMKLLIALNYGSQDELKRMVKQIATRVKHKELTVDDINEQLIEEHLFTKGLPPVDLLVRTSGEQRISNFLLWQIAYSELYFTETPWPEFKEAELDKAIAAYGQRNRRFGGIKQ